MGSWNLKSTQGAALVAAIALSSSFAFSQPNLTITPITWDVIGLDSNNAINGDGPDTFLVGARVTNTGDEDADNLTATFNWDPADTRPNVGNFALVDNQVLHIEELAPGQSQDFYYSVQINRSTPNGSARRYTITAVGDNAALVSTPTPRQLITRPLISQARNSTEEIIGPSKVYVGASVQYIVESSTATQGYRQLVAAINFPNDMFRFVSTPVTYSAPPGETNTFMYADACGWVTDPTDPDYLSCTTSNRIGGQEIITIYNLEAVGPGTVTLFNLIYDFSGNSYHYNGDLQDPISTLELTVVYRPIISGRIFNDLDGDGIQDPGEPGLAGVDVIITDADGNVFTVTTDANGDYEVEVETDGMATVTVDDTTLPEGFVLTTGNDSQNINAVDDETVAAGPIGYQQAQPDMSFTETASVSNVGSGATYTYTLEFTNNASASPLARAENVTITNTLPRIDSFGDQVDLLDVTFGGGFTGSYTIIDGVLVITINEDVLPGETGTVTLTVKTADPVPDQSIVNSATLNHTDYQGNAMDPLVDSSNIDVSPLLVELEEFTVTRRQADGRLVLTWSTSAEFDAVGFDVHRFDGASKSSPGLPLNGEMIPAMGSPVSGHVYTFTDPEPHTPGEARAYILVETELSGATNTHGPAWYPGPAGNVTTSVDDWLRYE